MGGTCYTRIWMWKWTLVIINKCPNSEIMIHVHKPGNVRNAHFFDCVKVWSIFADMGVSTKITITKWEILQKIHIK